MSDQKIISDLEHALIESKITEMDSKMHEGFFSINKAITDEFKVLRVENKAFNNESVAERKEILKRQDLTNGRVKALEVVTSSWKFLQENKKIAALVFYAIYNMLQHLSVSNLFRLYQWIQSVI